MTDPVTDSAPETIVSDFFELVMAGKAPEAIERFLTSDFVWDNPLPEGIPFGGRFEGHAGAAAYLELIFKTIEMEEFTINEIVASKDRVVILGREVSCVRTTGRRYQMDWVHVLHIRDGQIAYLREYNDTAAMQPAFA